MKTKKISWQAIAIVVLALVLIASIALGVSGAWFQDKDNAEQSIQMGKPVLIKLADKTSGGEVESFGSKYQTGVKAFPGDFVLGATKVMAASDTATIYRAKIETEVKNVRQWSHQIKQQKKMQTPLKQDIRVIITTGQEQIQMEQSNILQKKSDTTCI